MMSVMDIHPSDLTKLFASLIEKGLIYQEGTGRGTIYFLPDARLDDAIAEFEAKGTRALGVGTGGSEASSGGLGLSSGGLPASSGGLDDLMAIAAPLAQTRKVARALVEETLLKLCDVRPLRLEELEKLTGRSGEFLRKEYLQPLIKARRLRLQYPTKPSHPEQAYLTVRNAHDH